MFAAALTAAVLLLGAPPPPNHPVTEVLHGISITDPYRGFEALDPATLQWIRDQGRASREALNALPGRAARRDRLAALDRQVSAVDSYQWAGGRAFYRLRGSGSDAFDLVMRDAKGVHMLIDIAKLSAERGGRPFAINFFLASPDGRKVAAGISEGGSEQASIRVYDAIDGRELAGPIERGSLGLLAWRADSAVLYLNRLQVVHPGMPASDKYRGSRVEAWDLHSPPRPLEAANGSAPQQLRATDLPQLVVSPDAPNVVLAAQDGAETDYAYWLAPAAGLLDGAMDWKPFVSHDDGITDLQMHGHTIFLLSHRASPTFQVLAVEAGEPLATARVVIGARADRVIEMIRPASDGLYIVARTGIYAHLLRYRYTDGSIEEVALPPRSQVTEAFTRADRPGITMQVESWMHPPRTFAYDPNRRTAHDLGLTPQPRMKMAGLDVVDIEAEAHDGAAVPLTLMRKRSGHRPQVTLLKAYGSYGISELPHFNSAYIELTQEGAAFADCHVRGGGEFGEAWRLGGKDALKANTWRDLIACAEDLIRRGITTRDKLFLYGGSAGGIAVGRAMTDRPDLFAGVIAAVPAVNTTRMEFSPDGPLEVQEFGSVRTESGFKNLLAMDTYQHVLDGVRYPPLLITLGLNDPRIPAWEPAKLAARLMAADPRNEVLLRVDAENGHGIGATRTQTEDLWADILSFVFRPAQRWPHEANGSAAHRLSLGSAH